MEGQDMRGRSPSVGRSNNISHSPSPHSFNREVSGLGLDPSLTSNNSPFTNTQSSDAIDPSSSSHAPIDISTPFLTASSQSVQYPQGGVSDTSYLQHQGFPPTYKQDHLAPNHRSPPPSFGQQQQQDSIYSQNYFDPNNNSANFQDFALFQSTGEQDPSFDPSLLVDPALQATNPQQNQSINPADIMSTLSSPNLNNTTPPHLLQPGRHTSPSLQTSPSTSQGAFRSQSPNHSRHTSLDPSSAVYSQSQQPTDWTGMLQSASFQTHRRAPSEQSDVSSSVAPSPYLNQNEAFESIEQQHSPLLGAQHDPSMFQNALGIEQFTLSESQNQQGISPGHSPHISPRLMPQQEHGLPSEGHFGMLQNAHNQFGSGSGGDMYHDRSQEAFPPFQQRHELNDMGQATQMAPPEINIEFAPQRQPSFEPPKPNNDYDALSPPERARRRNRAASDPYGGTAISRPVSPGGNSPRLSPTCLNRSLSPLDIAGLSAGSGSSSPSQKSSRRSSTSSIPNRDYILDLADPQRPGAQATDSKRVQKHPATFQCTLCPKRFTRAYNLRSHLRTHTDERPFVCTVCGKAFARQHDRKRHEGLHSGEKKFVCKGELKSGGSWGCGRRFARADALGRHFRSEAGRICIKPLLDEEAIERQRIYNNQQMMNAQSGMHVMQQQPLNLNGMDANGNFAFPAALLAQHPALANLSWDAMGGGNTEEAEISGRSSFDASSGGEYYDDDDGSGSGYVSGPGTGYASGPPVGGWGNEWASDYEGR
ncbi:MAG: hypothetical protein M1812_005652 [Candelaria pacifica]|nr:MAG: hypothetical protein M1812_005652 [Candelaria pacifica]